MNQKIPSHFVIASFHAKGKGSGGRLINNTKYIQSRNLACIFGRLKRNHISYCSFKRFISDQNHSDIKDHSINLFPIHSIKSFPFSLSKKTKITDPCHYQLPKWNARAKHQISGFLEHLTLIASWDWLCWRKHYLPVFVSHWNRLEQ